jgi:hypothetical protein
MSGKELFTKSEFDSKRDHPEFKETVRTADWLRGQIYNGRNIMHTNKPFSGLRFTHMPSEAGDATAGFFSKRMGLDKGWSDFIFLWEGANVGFVEMKAKGKTQRPDQVGFHNAITEMGFKYKAVCCTTEEVRDKLIAWGVPYTPVPIPPRKLTHAEQLAAQWEWSRPS